MYFLHPQTSNRKDSSTKFRSELFEAHGYSKVAQKQEDMNMIQSVTTPKNPLLKKMWNK